MHKLKRWNRSNREQVDMRIINLSIFHILSCVRRRRRLTLSQKVHRHRNLFVTLSQPSRIQEQVDKARACLYPQNNCSWHKFLVVYCRRYEHCRPVGKQSAAKIEEKIFFLFWGNVSALKLLRTSGRYNCESGSPCFVKLHNVATLKTSQCSQVCEHLT